MLKKQPLILVLYALVVSAATLSGESLAEGSRKTADARRATAAARSIHIDTATVLCIAERGVQPNSKAVPQKGKRPAGLAVFGVSSLGLGVADGDVLTDVLGQPVRSQTQVVAMVLAARNQNMTTISATLWRGTKPYTVTVDQPYDVPNCSADEPGCWRAHCSSEPKKAPPPADKRDTKH